jgi:DNA-binding LytR/AlgR family response regulator
MKILLVEDDPLYASQLEMLIGRMGYTIVGPCDSAFDALDLFHREKPDLLLLDIHLAGDVDGIQLAQRANQAHPTPTVFVTSMQDDHTFARAQKIQPAAFIIKPFDALQLQRTIELAVGKMAPGTAPDAFDRHDLVLADCLFVKVRDKLEKVPLDDILYVEADDRHSILHTQSNHKFALRLPLSELETKLPVSRFARSHRSYLIHLRWIQSVDLQAMTIQVKEKQVPLSKGCREQILERLEQI